MIIFRRFSRIPAKKASFWGLILRISGRANGGLHSIMQGNMRCSEAQRVDLGEGLDKGDTIQTRTIKGILLGFHGFLTATAPRAYNGYCNQELWVIGCQTVSHSWFESISNPLNVKHLGLSDNGRHSQVAVEYPGKYRKVMIKLWMEWGTQCSNKPTWADMVWDGFTEFHHQKSWGDHFYRDPTANTRWSRRVSLCHARLWISLLEGRLYTCQRIAAILRYRLRLPHSSPVSSFIFFRQLLPLRYAWMVLNAWRKLTYLAYLKVCFHMFQLRKLSTSACSHLDRCRGDCSLNVSQFFGSCFCLCGLEHSDSSRRWQGCREQFFEQ